MKRFLANLICAFVPNKGTRHKIRAWFKREKMPKNNIARLEQKIDTISRNLDFANGKIVWLESLARVNTDVAKMPMSQGWQRLLHRGGGKMLELVDIICRDNNIPYFLYAGSLIGAKLYGKAVQWDDDWDIGMLRPDFDNFRAICEELFADSEFNPTFIGISIQFRFRKSPVYGDVFPFDQYSRDLTTPDDFGKVEQILRDAKDKFDWNLWHWQERIDNRSLKIPSIRDYEKTKKLYSDLIMNGKPAVQNGVLFENPLNPGVIGADGRRWFRTNENNIFRYDWIFPLQRIVYEDVEVFAPNNIDAVLGQKFGDIYDLPSKLDTQHSNKPNFSDLQDIDDLLKMDMNKVYIKLKKTKNKKEI